MPKFCNFNGKRIFDFFPLVSWKFINFFKNQLKLEILLKIRILISRKRNLPKIAANKWVLTYPSGTYLTICENLRNGEIP